MGASELAAYLLPDEDEEWDGGERRPGRGEAGSAIPPHTFTA
jgi:hypothetical protein